MKKLLYIIVLFAFACISCSDSDDGTDRPNRRPDPETKPKENPYKTGVDLSESASVKWSRKGIDDTYLMLGYGYDVTGKYAHPAWVRNKIIDVERYKAEGRGSVTLFHSTSSQADIGYDGTTEESRKQLASKAGFSLAEMAKYKNLFKATFSSEFKSDTSFPNLQYYYSGYSGIYTTFMGQFTYKTDRVGMEYLTNEFKSDLEKKSAKEVVEKYGTHILMGVLVGKRLDYQYRCNSSDMQLRSSWLNYNAIYYLDFDPSNISISKPEKDSPDKENLYIEAIDGIGAMPNAWMIDITNYKGKPIKFHRWKEDIPDSKLSLINFRRDNSLIPIYDVVTDPVKKEQLRNAVEVYLSE